MYTEITAGFLIVDKPHGWSSFDCTNKIAWELKNHFGLKKKPKVGHTGTLDPYATGVLVVAVHKATKLIESLKEADKDYVATLGFGIKSETYDLDSDYEVIEGVISPSEKSIEDVLTNYRGDIMQIPPAFSALKVDGKRSYALARMGKKVVHKPRSVSISALNLLSQNSITIDSVEIPTLSLFMTVSKGTYVRSLARDIGSDLNLPCVLTDLRRTRVGQASLEGGDFPVLKLTKETDYKAMLASLIDVDTFLG